MLAALVQGPVSDDPSCLNAQARPVNPRPRPSRRHAQPVSPAQADSAVAQPLHLLRAWERLTA